MTKFEFMKGLFGLLPTPYTDDLEIHTEDLKKVANFCCESGQHGIVWPVMVGEYYYLGESERIANLDSVLDEVNGRNSLANSNVSPVSMRTGEACLSAFQLSL